jgi:hypothetical protein
MEPVTARRTEKNSPPPYMERMSRSDDVGHQVEKVRQTRARIRCTKVFFEKQNSIHKYPLGWGEVQDFERGGRQFHQDQEVDFVDLEFCLSGEPDGLSGKMLVEDQES